MRFAPLLTLLAAVLLNVATVDTPHANPMTEESRMATATFAGGCFWCMEPPFHALEGVSDVVAGFTGGSERNPSYEDVVYGRTGHRESARITYDPTVVSYEELLETFWRNIDPTDSGGQFADRGDHYKTAIFYHDDEQKRLAEASKRALAESDKFDAPIATEVLPVTEFYPAEDYHQDYYKKNPLHYLQYKRGSGRAGFIEKTWGDEGK